MLNCTFYAKGSDKMATTPKKNGRPRIEIKEDEFKKLCAIMCTEEEIADWFSCSIDTVNRWCKRTYGLTFADIYKKNSINARVSLRRAQFKLAEKNPTMAIWLGKQYLGQRDSFEAEVSFDKVDELIASMDKEAKRK